MTRLCLALAIATFSCCAAATSPVLFPPGKQLAESSAVVIAVPRSISCRVTGVDATSGFVKANSEVTWQVLVRWKGDFRVGDVFKSKQAIVADKQPCFYSYSKPLLLYLRGAQPFNDLWSYELPRAVEQLKELDAYRKRHGT
jgi:hypothetical protein